MRSVLATALVLVDIAPRLTTVKVTEPPKRQAGVRVGSVDELIAKIKETGAIA